RLRWHLLKLHRGRTFRPAGADRHGRHGRLRPLPRDSPNVKRVEDLKGKKFGISSFGGTPHSEAIMILRKHGMNPEKDVIFLQIGGSSSRYAALDSGSIDAAMLTPPFNKLATKRGFNEILSFNEIMNIPLGGLAVHTQKIKEKPDEIIKMIKAILKS